MTSITVTIRDARGSTPRDAGTAMTVWADRTEGTIGGGALEFEAIRQARDMMTSGVELAVRRVALGPDIGQCCGGTVTLDFRPGARDSGPLTRPLWVWGAGHVGRAVAQVMAPLADRQITVIDTTAERMPDFDHPAIRPLVASDPLRVVALAPADADHLIMTYSHDLDLKLCDALLRHSFASLGLIGSATKWARFRNRLAALGHRNDQIGRITCPIGDPTLGKHPQAIALGVATRLLARADMVKDQKTGTP